MTANTCRNEPANYRTTALPMHGTEPDWEGEIRDGLLATPKVLPSTWFYDERGSRLFEQICDTPEYYPTRTEQALLDRFGGEIMALAEPAHLIEFGSGSSRKTRTLLEAWPEQMASKTYWPLDVSVEMLERSGKSLAFAFPDMKVHALAGDYHQGLAHIPRVLGRRLVAFLGGTIGNFPPSKATAFLRRTGEQMGQEDCLLLGADRVKSPAILERAYNDEAGLTAAFNLNLLTVLNREFGANFDLRDFAHQAMYSVERQQIEMYLLARRRHRVRVRAFDLDVNFERGERMLTEISRKFTGKGLESLLSEAGFKVLRNFEAEDAWYSLLLARPVAEI